jgi:hypothetical protein
MRRQFDLQYRSRGAVWYAIYQQYIHPPPSIYVVRCVGVAFSLCPLVCT